ncbi:MAG: antibiotic biosynthesis monooxygenase [Actinomycetota bacterium]|nr:antibiotic biosynthesis monooxygenase [Actinomycetota bacterium]
MVIVAGWIRVGAADRADYLASCRAVVEAARSAPGCQDFCISADLVDAERINVFEQWDTVESVEAFRGSGPDGAQQDVIIDAHVAQHEVASSLDLT